LKFSDGTLQFLAFLAEQEKRARKRLLSRLGV